MRNEWSWLHYFEPVRNKTIFDPDLYFLFIYEVTWFHGDGTSLISDVHVWIRSQWISNRVILGPNEFLKLFFLFIILNWLFLGFNPFLNSWEVLPRIRIVQYFDKIQRRVVTTTKLHKSFPFSQISGRLVYTWLSNVSHSAILHWFRDLHQDSDVRWYCVSDITLCDAVVLFTSLETDAW